MENKEQLRDTLVKKSINLRNELSDLSTQIKKLDLEEKTKDLSKYVGKYFMETKNSEFEEDNKMVNCTYVYELKHQDNGNLDLYSLTVFHYNDECYYGIQHDHNFLHDVIHNNAFISWLDNQPTAGVYSFKEIIKEEYEKNFNHVLDIAKKNIKM